MCSVKCASCSFPTGSWSMPAGTATLTATSRNPFACLNQTLRPLRRMRVSNPANGLAAVSTRCAAAGEAVTAINNPPESHGTTRITEGMPDETIDQKDSVLNAVLIQASFEPDVAARGGAP